MLKPIRRNETEKIVHCYSYTHCAVFSPFIVFHDMILLRVNRCQNKGSICFINENIYGVVLCYFSQLRNRSATEKKKKNLTGGVKQVNRS